MPVYGTGFYPTTAQGAENYFAVIHRNFNPFLIQAALRKKPIFLYLVLRDLAESRAGGLSPITQPVQLSEFGGTISNVTFEGQFQVSPTTNPLLNAEWNMAMYMIAMDIYQPEIAMIQGEASPYTVIDVIKARFTDFYQKLLEYLEERVLGAAPSATHMNGLEEAVDDGTNYPVYGNINRGTYTAWNAAVYNLSNVNLPQAWQYVPYVLSRYRATRNGVGPNIVLCSYGTFYRLAMSLTAMEQIISADVNEVNFTKAVGFQALNISGLWIVPLQRLTGSTAYFLDFNSFKFYIHPDYFFAMTPLTSLMPINIMGWRTGITFAGNFVCLKPWNNIKVLNMPTETFTP